MTQPHFLFTVDKIGGRVRERFASPLIPVLSIKMERTSSKSSSRREEAEISSLRKDIQMVLELNVKDRAVILMHLDPDLDTKRAYFMALYDEYNYYHQLSSKDRLLYRSGELNNYLEIDV